MDFSRAETERTRRLQGSADSSSQQTGCTCAAVTIEQMESTKGGAVGRPSPLCTGATGVRFLAAHSSMTEAEACGALSDAFLLGTEHYGCGQYRE